MSLINNGLFIVMLVCAAPFAMSLSIGTMDPGPPPSDDEDFQMPVPSRAAAQASLLQTGVSAQQRLQENRRNSLEGMNAEMYTHVLEMDQLHQKYTLDTLYYGQTLDDLSDHVNRMAMGNQDGGDPRVRRQDILAKRNGLLDDVMGTGQVPVEQPQEPMPESE